MRSQIGGHHIVVLDDYCGPIVEFWLKVLSSSYYIYGVFLLWGSYGLKLGLFMALQPKIIACGNSVATFAMAVRFLTGPAVMAAASIAVGLRGTLLHVAIVQVAILFLQK